MCCKVCSFEDSSALVSQSQTDEIQRHPSSLEMEGVHGPGSRVGREVGALSYVVVKLQAKWKEMEEKALSHSWVTGQLTQP